MPQPLIKLLRRSEHFTKTDMVYLFNSSFWVFVGQVATSASAFVVMVVLANLISKETLGEYRYLISIVSILMIFTLPGLDTALVQSTARGFSGQLDVAVKTKMRWGLFAALIAGIGSIYYFVQGNASLGVSFAVVAACMPVFGAYFTYFFYLQGRQKFAEASLTQAAGRVLFLIVMIGTAYLMPTATALVAAFLLSTIIAQNLGSWWTNRRYKQEENPDPELIKYGKHLTLLGAMSVIAINIDKVAIWHLLGPTEVAIYTIALLLPLESARIGRMLNQAVMPKIAQKAGTINRNAFIKKIFILISLLIMVWIAYALVAPWIFALFFPDYGESVIYSIVAMLSIISTPAYILRGYFIAHKMKRQLNIVLITTPVLQIALLLVLMYLFGIWGAVIAYVLGGLIEIILSLTLASQSKNTSL